MSLKLYEIKNEYLRELNLLDQIINDLKPEDDAVEHTKEIIDTLLLDMEFDFDEKVKNLAAYILNLQGEVNAMKEYESNMYKRRKRAEDKIEGIKNYIKENMNSIGKKKVIGTEFNVVIKECKWSVEIIDSEKIPDEFFITKIERVIDNSKLGKTLESFPVQGAALKENYSLTIK